MVSSCIVMMYDLLCCKLFVIIHGYPCFLVGVLYITHVPIGDRLFVACGPHCPSLMSGTCSLPNLHPCHMYHSRSDLAYLANTNSIGNCKPLPSRCSCRASGNVDFHLSSQSEQQAFHKMNILFCTSIQLMIVE